MDNISPTDLHVPTMLKLTDSPTPTQSIKNSTSPIKTPKQKSIVKNYTKTMTYDYELQNRMFFYVIHLNC